MPIIVRSLICAALRFVVYELPDEWCDRVCDQVVAGRAERAALTCGQGRLVEVREEVHFDYAAARDGTPEVANNLRQAEGGVDEDVDLEAARKGQRVSGRRLARQATQSRRAADVVDDRYGITLDAVQRATACAGGGIRERRVARLVADRLVELELPAEPATSLKRIWPGRRLRWCGAPADRPQRG